MNDNEIQILVELLDNAILNYKYQRTKTLRESWLSKVDELEKLKNKIHKFNEDNLKNTLMLLMNVNLEVEDVVAYGKTELYITNKTDVISDFIEYINLNN